MRACLAFQIVTPVSAGRVEVQQLTRGVAKAVMLNNGQSPNGQQLFPSSTSSPVPTVPAQYASAVSPLPRNNNSPSPNLDNPFDDQSAVRIAIPSSAENTPVLPHTPTFGAMSSGTGHRNSSATTMTTRRDSDLSIFTSASGNLGPFAQQQQQQQQLLQAAREKLPRAASTASLRRSVASASTVGPSAGDEMILEPPTRPFANSTGTGAGPDSRHTSAALSTRSGYASVLDGIPFNLSLSPEAEVRHSQASSAGDGAGAGARLGGLEASSSNPFRDSAASASSSSSSIRESISDGKRDTSYSLASEWNGAFAGMPIVMGGGGPQASVGEAVPELPEEYRRAVTGSGTDADAGAGAGSREEKRDSSGTLLLGLGPHGSSSKDDRYSTDSLAMAAAVARSFNA